jgi:hypothetical protein
VAYEPSQRAREQLDAIAILDSALTPRGLDYWLFGGWAVDFWVGRITREHDDIDVAAWRRDYEAIKSALLHAGWRHTPVADEVVGTRYTWGSVEVEFTFLELLGDGAIVIPIPGNEIVWTTTPFGAERPALGDISARTIPLELLRAGKQMPREAPEQALKDRTDLEALAAITTR